MPNGEVFIAPEGTPPDSDEWRSVGFTETAAWSDNTSDTVVHERARDAYTVVHRALEEAYATMGARPRHVAISREQYEALEADAINRSPMVAWTQVWAGANPGRWMFGSDLRILRPEIPPPPGHADARPEQHWALGQVVQPVKRFAVSSQFVGDDTMLRRLRSSFLSEHGLPENWPCPAIIIDPAAHLPGVHTVELVAYPWKVGAPLDPYRPDNAPEPRESRRPRRGRRDGEAWSDYIDRISSTDEMDELLGELGDEMSVTFDGTEGEYPF